LDPVNAYLYPTIPAVALQPPLEAVQDVNVAPKAITNNTIAKSFFIFKKFLVIKYISKLALVGVGNNTVILQKGDWINGADIEAKKQTICQTNKLILITLLK